MNVEQENFLPEILWSVQRCRRWSGTSRDMARAKSALMTVASERYSPALVRTPTACRPEKRISRTGSLRRMSTPISRATRAIAVVTAPQPPIGWKMPYSYSRKERIENRLGHWNGDIPKYWDWKVNARRMRGSEK